MFPMEPTGPRDWHDVVVRGTGPNLELRIDGVLVDVEFPIGVTRPSTAPRYFGAAQLADGKLLAGFHGLMDHAALWHRALSEAEIIALSGGAELARERELAILGPQPERMQYFHARGHNSKAGDCIPFFHDGTFHLFYLVLRRNMHSKWAGNHGALEIHHASTRDLSHWQHHPIAVPISEQWEAWNGTGALVHHDGKFWMFYPCPDYDGAHGGIQLAASSDSVERESSLVTCVAAYRCQPTIDPARMQEWVPGVKWGAPALGCSFEESLKRRDELLPIIQKWSPDYLLHEGAAPMFFENEWGLTKPEDITQNNYDVHSPRWALGFQKLAQQAGAVCHVKFPGHPTDGYKDIWDFIVPQLQSYAP